MDSVLDSLASFIDEFESLSSVVLRLDDGCYWQGLPGQVRGVDEQTRLMVLGKGESNLDPLIGSEVVGLRGHRGFSTSSPEGTSNVSSQGEAPFLMCRHRSQAESLSITPGNQKRFSSPMLISISPFGRMA